MEAAGDTVLVLALSYLGATMAASGAAHLVRFGRFRGHVRAHAIVPARLQTPAAVVVALLEGGVGLAAVASLFAAEVVTRSALLALGVLAGTAFLFYLRRLLWVRGMRGSCGCSPLDGPLTPVSLLPAAAVVVASLLGLVATLAGSDATAVRDPLCLLMAGWGVTLALLVILLPATMPPVQAEVS
jgi:hypothetical protein